MKYGSHLRLESLIHPSGVWKGPMLTHARTQSCQGEMHRIGVTIGFIFTSMSIPNRSVFGPSLSFPVHASMIIKHGLYNSP